MPINSLLPNELFKEVSNDRNLFEFLNAVRFTWVNTKVKEEFFERKWYQYPVMRNVLAAGLLIVAGFSLARLGFIPHLVEIALYAIAIPLGGHHWVKEGFKKVLTEKKVGVEILMVAATAGSVALRFWDEAAFLAFLYGAAEGVEEYTFAKTRASIRKLLDLVPKQAHILRDGVELTVPAEELKIGDVFIVRPGESIPTDGIILKGRSSVNEAPVTGESIPVEKREGMRVFAGTINQEGALEVRATTDFRDNTLSKIIHLVEKAQEQKSKTQLFIEKFGVKYTPMVLLSALLLVAIPPLLGEEAIGWATRAVVLLVAAAPCALVMSTPVAIAAGIRRAGTKGALIKGGVHLENLGRLRAVAFDKTGTLTKGEPIVTDVIALDGDGRTILKLAYSVERFSEHPLAKAIVEEARRLGVEALDVVNFEALTGFGVRAEIEGETIYVGKPELFKELGVSIEHHPDVKKLKRAGKTIICIGTKRSVKGIIAVRDEIRPQAREVIRNLHGMGIKVIMLTGDSEATAKAIARELGIDDVRAGLRPEDKIRAIENLEREYGAVAMVGDGVNDAPALARATVGIAMGAIGTDAAIEAADVALMADDLTKVAYAIHLGKKAKKVSNQNIVFSLAVLASLIPLALTGMINVAIAVTAHEASELAAVANGLRTART